MITSVRSTMPLAWTAMSSSRRELMAQVLEDSALIPLVRLSGVSLAVLEVGLVVPKAAQEI